MCICLSRETQVLSPRSDGLPRVNTRVFFFRPFSANCPGLIPRVFFFFLLLRPFPAGLLCRRRTCPGLIPRVFSFPRPFPAGCPRLIPGFFFLFFFRPFPAGRRSWVPTSLYLCTHKWSNFKFHLIQLLNVFTMSHLWKLWGIPTNVFHF